jgi:hypothetical protein
MRNTKKTVSRWEWVLKQQEAIDAVRELQFALTQLEEQIDQLLSGFQTLMLGRVPLSLAPFTHMHSILKNVTLNLQEGYELAMGSNYNQHGIIYT